MIGEVVQGVTEIDVGHVTQRNQVRKADAMACGPIQYRSHDRTRLGHEGQMAGFGRRLGETGIDAETRDQDAQAVRADDAQIEWLRRVQDRLLQLVTA